MKVQATQRGYYGQQREPGDVFVLTDKRHLSNRWMVVVEPEKPAKAKADPKAE